MNKALFLDRDGILIDDKGYVGSPDAVKILSESIQPLQLARRLGFLLIVVTNQSGVAKGMFSLRDVEVVNKKMKEDFSKVDIEFSDIFICPYHEKGSVKEYSLKSENRKPRPGMLLQAGQKYSLRFENCLMVGDKDSDVIELDGLQTILIQGKYKLNRTDKVGNWKLVEETLRSLSSRGC